MRLLLGRACKDLGGLLVVRWRFGVEVKSEVGGVMMFWMGGMRGAGVGFCIYCKRDVYKENDGVYIWESVSHWYVDKKHFYQRK